MNPEAVEYKVIVAIISDAKELACIMLISFYFIRIKSQNCKLTDVEYVNVLLLVLALASTSRRRSRTSTVGAADVSPEITATTTKSAAAT